LSALTVKTPGELAAKRPMQKQSEAAFQARPVEAISNPESRIQSILKRFSKSLAHLAK
jgi:hypothetical protein